MVPGDTAVADSEPRSAHAVWFGEADAPLLGFLHPAKDHAKDVVVVMCNPFGYDAAITHHAYQKIAESLGQAGVAALRFDYLGTGDSAGEGDAKNTLPNWIASIGHAVAEARRASGATNVVLFGARFGALLATAYAQANPVAGLVLLGPSRSGAVFVRELLALNSIRTANPRDFSSADIQFPDDEVDGYPLSSELRAAIAELDPRTVDRAPAPRALVIARDDLPGPEARLVEHLRGLGVAVEHSHAPGYRDVFEFKALPAQTVDEIVQWTLEVAGDSVAVLEGGDHVDTNPGGRTATFEGITEELVRFSGCFGIVTESAVNGTRRDTGILLLGAGAHSHIGLYRMHVTFARVLAALGFRVLRFDLSGIGESAVRDGEPERLFYTAYAVPETISAIDYMISRGCAEVALFGICSGGYTAFHTALADPRVVAIVSANSPGFYFNPFDAAVLAMSGRAPWIRTLRRKTGEGRTFATVRPVNHPGNRIGFQFDVRASRFGFPTVSTEDWPTPPSLLDYADDVARGFGKILERGCKTLLVYGSADPSLHVLEQHLGADIAERGTRNLELARMEGTNHTFTPRIAQQRLGSLVTAFFDRELR